MTLTRLKLLFDRNFGPPFLAPGTVETRLYTDRKRFVLHIRIGRREVEVNEQGEVLSSGTVLQ